MDDMTRIDEFRRMAYAVAFGARLLSLVALAGFTALQFASHPQVFNSTLSFVAWMIAASSVMVALSSLLELAIYIPLARVMTHAPTAKWMRPSECNGFGNWLGWTWQYYSEGWQRGYRVLGLDVVLRGRL